MRIIGRLVLLSLLGILLSGCDSSYGSRFVKHEVKDFHDSFNDGKYSAIYTGAAEDMHQIGTEESFVKFLASMHQQLGKVVSSKNKSWDTRVQDKRREILLIQNTEFEHGTGVETFSYVLVEGKALLQGYHIKVSDTSSGQ